MGSSYFFPLTLASIRQLNSVLLCPFFGSECANRDRGEGEGEGIGKVLLWRLNGRRGRRDQTNRVGGERRVRNGRGKSKVSALSLDVQERLQSRLRVRQ